MSPAPMIVMTHNCPCGGQSTVHFKPPRRWTDSRAATDCKSCGSRWAHILKAGSPGQKPQVGSKLAIVGPNFWSRVRSKVKAEEMEKLKAESAKALDLSTVPQAEEGKNGT